MVALNVAELSQAIKTERENLQKGDQMEKMQKVNNSLQSRLDYSRYDDGPNAMDVPLDIPPKDLLNLMVSYYSANIKVTEATATQLSTDTADQGERVLCCGMRKKKEA